MLHTAVSKKQFHAILLCTKLDARNQFLFYISCCIGKSLNITYSESVFLDLGTQKLDTEVSKYQFYAN
jgi:hypothetical protein